MKFKWDMIHINLSILTVQSLQEMENKNQTHWDENATGGTEGSLANVWVSFKSWFTIQAVTQEHPSVKRKNCKYEQYDEP